MPSFKDEINVHQYTTSNSFATSPSVNVQSVPLSLQPVESRATLSEVTNPARFLSGNWARRFPPPTHGSCSQSSVQVWFSPANFFEFC